MIIEPQDAYTVKTPVVVAPLGERGESYEDNVLRRFGTIDPAKLARMENRQMWKHHPGPNWDSSAKAQKIAASRPPGCKVNALPPVDHKARRAVLIAAMPGTVSEIARRTQLTGFQVQDSLRRMKKLGMVKTTRKANVNVWSAAE